MRFVSKYKRYTVVFQREIVEHYATGQSRELQPYLGCAFDLYGSMTPHEVVVARTAFSNYGLPTEVDNVTLIDPLYRFSVFDTELFAKEHGLDDAKREEMEAFLLSRPEYGGDYIMVEEPRLAPPWPTYDDFRGVRGLPTAAAIAKKVSEDGFNVDDVIAYERQNANRSDVITELENIGAPEFVVDDNEGLVKA